MTTKRRFDTTDYQLTYGHSPRGRGSWAFAPADAGRVIPALDNIAWESGTYTEAKAAVARRFPGVTRWVVLT